MHVMTDLFPKIISLPPPVERITNTPGKAITDVLRLDMIHPVISGNKWFKLKYALETAQKENYSRITTFGGAFSNHIVATAYACKQAGIRCRGIIRGEPTTPFTHSLLAAANYGMEIEYMSRTDFRQLREDGFRLPGSDNDYLIPEGGAFAAGVRGAKEILEFVAVQNYSHIICAIGTGTTAAGLLQCLNPGQQLICINVLKGGSFQEKDIIGLSGKTGENLVIRNEFHFGGYAHYTPELIQFMNTFYEDTGIPSDFVYTAKLFYAWQYIVALEMNNADARILVIHSGGLQGNASLFNGTLIF